VTCHWLQQCYGVPSTVSRYHTPNVCRCLVLQKILMSECDVALPTRPSKEISVSLYNGNPLEFVISYTQERLFSPLTNLMEEGFFLRNSLLNSLFRLKFFIHFSSVPCMLHACPGRDEYVQNFEIQITFAIILIQIVRVISNADV